MKVLITGSDGMIGSRLTKYLTEKYDQGPDQVDQFEGEISNPIAWQKYQGIDYDFVIHLAGQAGVRTSFEDPDGYFRTNVDGTQCALDFAEQCGAKTLYASSSNAYEWWGNPYAATKKINEVQARGKQAIGMRFHTVWPGRDDMLFRKLERNEVEYININHTRDFIHVWDLIQAIQILIDRFNVVIKTDPVVDIGTGQSVSILDVARMYGFDGEERSENPAGEREKTEADVNWLLKLGWEPEYNILNREHHVDYV